MTTKVRQLELKLSRPVEVKVEEVKEEIKPEKKYQQWHNKLENFKGKGGGVGRPLSLITVEELLKRGQILEREMKNSEAQAGKMGRVKELHLKVGKGIVNTTRLVRDDKLTIKRLKGEKPLRKAVHLSANLKQAFIEYLETGNIEDELNDVDQGMLYSIIADLEHYGNHTPEEFYRDKLLSILKRGELTPSNSNLKSQFETMLSIARQLKFLSKASERYYEERAKSVFKEG